MAGKTHLFIGIDLGGTKVAAALVAPGGAILHRCKRSTPQEASSDRGQLVLQAVRDSVAELMAAPAAAGREIKGIGLAVPGPVNYDANTVPFMPNLDVGGADLAAGLAESAGLAVQLVNDGDAIAVGDGWYGPVGHDAHVLVDLAVGTGIGGGILIDGELFRGAGGSSAEVGHMMLDPGGALCGCGNRGCLETVASRTAIERYLWQQAGGKGAKAPAFAAYLRPGEKRIRSGVLAKALKDGDEAVAAALTRAAEALGRACVTLKHLLTPDLVILGGGVMESCGDFMLPAVRRVVEASTFMAHHRMEIVLSALGDDAGVLGAAAMAMRAAGLTTRQARTLPNPVGRHGVAVAEEGFKFDGELFFAGDMTVTVRGEALPRRRGADESLDSPARLKLPDIRRACEGGPQLLLIGSPRAAADGLRPKARDYLDSRAIQAHLLSVDEAIAAYNASPVRTALMLLTG